MSAGTTAEDCSSGSSVGSGRRRRPDGETARWTCSSNEVTNLKLIREEDDLFPEDGYFHPTYTNQVAILPIYPRL